MNIDTSLLREKFVIQEHGATDDGRALRLNAFSNRIVLKLQAGTLPTEVFVIRTNTMHSCARMAAQILSTYDHHGPIVSRMDSIDWKSMWEGSNGNYDKVYNLARWVAIYHKGKIIYQSGQHHNFFDVIEQCDALSDNDYKKSIPLAKQTFQKAGKVIDIEHDINVAMVAVTNRHEGRCSMLLRGAKNKATFNMIVAPKGIGARLNAAQILSSAADFLEGTQLSFIVGLSNEQLNQGLIRRFSDEDKRGKKAHEEIKILNARIDGMNNRHKVRYRPERPDFDLLIAASEKEAREQLYDLNNSGY